MMMKKTTSALAVAALLGTGAATAATFQVNDDTSISVGGDFQIAYRSIDDTNGDSKTTFIDNGSSLVFSGEHTTENGLTTFFNLDLDGFNTVQADSEFQGNEGSGDGNSDGSDVDEASIGVRGAFGSILVGSEISVYDAYADFADTDDTLGSAGVGGPGDQSQVIQYSNSASNVTYTLEAQVNADDDQTGGGKTNDGVSMAAGFEADLGAVTLAGAYDTRSNTVDEAVYGLNVSTTFNGLDLAAGYQKSDDTDGDGTNSAQVESELTSLVAGYSIGKIALTGVIDMIDKDGEDDRTETYAKVAYNTTDNTYIYAETRLQDKQNDAGDGMAVGVYYGW